MLDAVPLLHKKEKIAYIVGAAVYLFYVDGYYCRLKKSDIRV